MINNKFANNKIWIWIILGALILWAGIKLFAPSAILVEVRSVTRGHYQQTIEEDGQTRAKDIFQIIAPVSGELKRITLSEGDQVKKANVLAQIISGEASLLDLRSKNVLEKLLISQQAALKKAKATEEKTEIAKNLDYSQYQRNIPLEKDKNISEFELEQSELEYKQRVKELEAAEYEVQQINYQVELIRVALLQFSNELMSGDQELQHFNIRAPASGQILKIERKSSGAIMAGDVIMELADPNHLEIVVDMLSTDAIKIPTNADAVIKRWGGSQNLTAKVRLVEPRAFTKISTLGVEEQRVNVILDLISPQELWQKLGSGYRVDVEVILFAADNELTIPVSALFRAEGQWAVFKVQGNKAMRQFVTVKWKNNQTAVISKGLVVNNKVILYPSDQIKDGARIQEAN